MKTTRLLMLAAALMLVAACGTKGDLVHADSRAANAGSSLPTGGTAPERAEVVHTTPVANADGEIPDTDADADEADDESGDADPAHDE